MQRPLDLAIEYCRMGLSPIPVPFRQKKPILKGWPQLRITAETAPKYFNNKPANVGGLLGINGLSDIDLDCAEARVVADILLPETGFRFGRRSALDSHRFYRVDGSLSYRKFTDPLRDEEEEKATILEIRSAVGHQTVLPGSTHPTGEMIEFSSGATRIPQNVDAETLKQAATRLAAAALIGRYFARDGTRNEAFIALAGALARSGWPEEDALNFNLAIYRILWGQSADRTACQSETKATFEKFRANGRIVGIPRLKELINRAVIDKALTWLGIREEATGAPPRAESSASDWLKPIPLTAKMPDPISADVLPGALGEYARALSKHTETPIDLPILAVIGATSTAVAGKVEVEAEFGYIEPAHIWVCPLLESGNRKTAAIDAIRAPIDEHEDSERARLEPEFRRLVSDRRSKLATIEKLRKTLSVNSPETLEEQRRHIADLEAELPDEPHRITLTTSDATPEALEELMQENGGRMAIISDEGGMFDIMAGRYSSQPNLDVFLKGHTGGRVNINRRCRNTFIPRAYLTMCIAPQPGVIQGLKDKPFMRDRGLLARFLWAVPESPIGHRDHSTISIPDGVNLRYRTVIARLLHWQPERPVRLRLNERARREWKDFQRHIESLMAEGCSLDRLHDWGSKLPGAALRIAGMFSVVDDQLPSVCVPERIEYADIERATALCAALIPHAIAAFNLVAEDPNVSLAKLILRWLRKQEGDTVTRRDCFRALHRQFDQVADMDAPLQVLVNHFYVRTGSVRTGGRPSELIEINPQWKRDEDLA